MHLFGMLKKLRKRMDRARQPLKLTGTGQILILIAFAIGAAAMNTGNNLLYLAWALVLSAIIFSGLISEVTLGIVKASVSHIMDARVGESFQIPVVLNNRSRFLASFGILPIVSFFVGQEHRHVVGEYVLRLKASGRRELRGVSAALQRTREPRLFNFINAIPIWFFYKKLAIPNA